MEWRKIQPAPCARSAAALQLRGTPCVMRAKGMVLDCLQSTPAFSLFSVYLFYYIGNPRVPARPNQDGWEARRCAVCGGRVTPAGHGAGWRSPPPGPGPHTDPGGGGGGGGDPCRSVLLRPLPPLPEGRTAGLTAGLRLCPGTAASPRGQSGRSRAGPGILGSRACPGGLPWESAGWAIVPAGTPLRPRSRPRSWGARPLPAARRRYRQGRGPGLGRGSGSAPKPRSEPTAPLQAVGPDRQQQARLTLWPSARNRARRASEQAAGSPRRLHPLPAAERREHTGHGRAIRAQTPPGRTRPVRCTARRLGWAGRSLQHAWGHHAGLARAVDGEPWALPRSTGRTRGPPLQPSSKDQHWAAPTTARSSGRFL